MNEKFDLAVTVRAQPCTREGPRIGDRVREGETQACLASRTVMRWLASVILIFLLLAGSTAALRKSRAASIDFTQHPIQVNIRVVLSGAQLRSVDMR